MLTPTLLERIEALDISHRHDIIQQYMPVLLFDNSYNTIKNNHKYWRLDADQDNDGDDCIVDNKNKNKSDDDIDHDADVYTIGHIHIELVEILRKKLQEMKDAQEEVGDENSILDIDDKDTDRRGKRKNSNPRMIDYKSYENKFLFPSQQQQQQRQQQQQQQQQHPESVTTLSSGTTSTGAAPSNPCRNRFFGLVVHPASYPSDELEPKAESSNTKYVERMSPMETRTKVLECFTDLLIECQVIPKRHTTDMYPVIARRRQQRRRSNSPKGKKEGNETETTGAGKKNGANTNEDEHEDEEELILATVNRNAAPYLGLDSVGVHLLCYVRHATQDDNINNTDGSSVSLWLAQRSENKSQYPLSWDPTVAGGQPYGISLHENMIKEAYEEAGIDRSMIVHHAVPAIAPSTTVSSTTTRGADDDNNSNSNHNSKLLVPVPLSRMTCSSNNYSDDKDGRRRMAPWMKYSLYYTWDLEVDRDDFIPTAIDGEVTQFQLFTTKELLYEIMYGTKLRPAMILVITEFLIRHQLLTPDLLTGGVDEYTAIIAALRHRKRVIVQYRNKSNDY